MQKVNLLKETEQELNDHGKTWADVACVAVLDSYIEDDPEPKDYYFDIDTAKRMMDFEYDSSYGIAHVDRNLVVIGKDGWWLSRQEYDGAEWWQFNVCPKIRENKNRYPNATFYYGNR